TADLVTADAPDPPATVPALPAAIPEPVTVDPPDPPLAAPAVLTAIPVAPDPARAGVAEATRCSCPDAWLIVVRPGTPGRARGSPPGAPPASRPSPQPPG